MSESTELGTPAGGIGELGGSAPAPRQNPEGVSAFKTMVSGLEPQLSRNPNLSRHENFDGLAKEYVHLVSKIGEKGVLPPKAGDENDRNRFYSELGRPQDAASYNFGEWKPPEGLPWDDGTGAAMVKAMWDQGLSQDQVPPLIEKYGEIQNELWNQRQQIGAQANSQTIDALQSELGNAYPERMNLAHRAVSEYFGSENVDSILETRLENGVALGDWMPFVRAMLGAGQSLKEDDLVDDSTKKLPGAKTPHEAQSEMESLMRDSDFKAAYLDSQHPNHKMALTKMDELYAYKGSAGSETDVAVGPNFEFTVTPEGRNQ